MDMALTCQRAAQDPELAVHRGRKPHSVIALHDMAATSTELSIHCITTDDQAFFAPSYRPIASMA